MTLVSKVAIFHFHDYGWKGTSTYEAQTRRSNEFGGRPIGVRGCHYSLTMPPSFAI